MKTIWYIVNTGCVMWALWGGYRSTAPDRLQHANPDLRLCFVLLLIMPLFSLGIVYYSIRRWRQDTVQRPSWHRNPINWWGDPLQALFISTCFVASMAIGAALRHPAIGSVGFWMLGVYYSVGIGLLIGQLLVYRVFRRHILDV